MSAPDMSLTMQQQVARLGALPEIRAAFAGLRSGETQWADWQMEASRIAAPPFAETARGEWLAERFRELGLDDVHIDQVGNVFGICPGSSDRSGTGWTPPTSSSAINNCIPIRIISITIATIRL